MVFKGVCHIFGDGKRDEKSQSKIFVYFIKGFWFHNMKTSYSPTTSLSLFIYCSFFPNVLFYVIRCTECELKLSVISVNIFKHPCYECLSVIVKSNKIKCDSPERASVCTGVLGVLLLSNVIFLAVSHCCLNEKMLTLTSIPV